MKLLKKLGLSVLVACLMPAPLIAQDFYQDRSMSQYTGFYLTVPFGGAGGRHQEQERMRFGFVSGYRQDSIGGRYFDPTGRKPAILPVTTADFSSDGFEQIQLAGMNIVSIGPDGWLRILNADQSEGEEGTSIGDLLLVGTGIAGGLLVIAAVGSCVDSGDFQLKCPV